jgi:hypothetical protein
MAWEVEYTDQFGEWFDGLNEEQQAAVIAYADTLEATGPSLGYPRSSDVKGSRHGRMRELRVQAEGRPLRVFYAFDPRRAAILLIGGDKTGDGRFYEVFIPIADRLYDEHLKELEQEGLLNG